VRDMKTLSRTISNNVDAIKLLIEQAQGAQSAVCLSWLTLCGYGYLFVPAQNTPQSQAKRNQPERSQNFTIGQYGQSTSCRTRKGTRYHLTKMSCRTKGWLSIYCYSPQ
jgi:hypothetical protein